MNDWMAYVQRRKELAQVSEPEYMECLSVDDLISRIDWYDCTTGEHSSTLGILFPKRQIDIREEYRDHKSLWALVYHKRNERHVCTTIGYSAICDGRRLVVGSKNNETLSVGPGYVFQKMDAQPFMFRGVTDQWMTVKEGRCQGLRTIMNATDLPLVYKEGHQAARALLEMMIQDAIYREVF